MRLTNNMDNPPVYNKRLSTVVPGRMTAENNKVHELTSMDLAMKLHYLRGVYFFKSEAVQGLGIFELKVPMFKLLDLYYPASGRIRRPENGGRPSIQCNDSGVRICEAQSNRTLEEWMEMIKDDCSLNGQLNYNHALGPVLEFSPLVFIQFTWFKCGGMSLGLSWAHILGDAFAASSFINMLGQILGGNNLPPQPPKSPNTGKYKLPSFSKNPFSLKRVDPVGDYWVTPNTCKMETHSFHFTSKQLNQLLLSTCGLSQTGKNKIMPFEFLSAIMWKSLAKIRGIGEPKIVTICTNNSLDMGIEIPNNRQVVSTIEADLMVANADILELAKLIGEKKVDEREMIEDLIEREEGNLDFIVYGANLTFVNLEEARIYELELKGFKTIYANYTIDGVGDEGVVLILPSLENDEKGGNGGRNVTVVLPNYQLVQLKDEVKKWEIM